MTCYWYDGGCSEKGCNGDGYIYLRNGLGIVKGSGKYSKKRNRQKTIKNSCLNYLERILKEE